MPLERRIIQDDFAAGMVRSVARQHIPENGCYDTPNFLTDDDGSLSRRGGAEYLTPPAFGAEGLLFMWEGWLAGGKRTVVANTLDFGVVNEAEDAFITIGGAGVDGPTTAVEIAGVLFIGGGTIYAGSLKTAEYLTGTVEVDEGSPTLTGTGTSWLANVDRGMLIQVEGQSRYYVVEEIVSDTEITLTEDYRDSSASGQDYVATPFGGAVVSSDAYATVADRLVYWEGSKLHFSPAGDPFTFEENDYHELWGGGQILGAHSVRDVLLVFATNGVWLISNMAYDITDEFGNPQHRLEHAHPELVLWRGEGVASWENALAVPCLDGLWLMDGQSAPKKLTRSIEPYWQSHAEAGYRLGSPTVHRDHYLVPVLDDEEVVDFLVCRLDRPIASRAGEIFPWTRFEGHGSQLAAVAQRVDEDSREPELIGAHREAGRLVSLKFFEADEVFTDPDGSYHQVEPIFRDYRTGALTTNLVRRLRIGREQKGGLLRAAQSDGTNLGNPTEWGLFDWGQADWFSPDDAEWASLAGAAPEDVRGLRPWTWFVNKHRRFFRPRLKSSGPVEKLILRSVEVYVRPSAKER